jgi:hypothetical protein
MIKTCIQTRNHNRTGKIISSIGHIVIFGLPLTIYFGIITFISLLTTAIIGILVLKGLYNIPFKWHM